MPTGWRAGDGGRSACKKNTIGYISKSAATPMIIGDQLIPSEATKVLSHTPSFEQTKGQRNSE